jgi:uncharacterized Tic20 family protein
MFASIFWYSPFTAHYHNVISFTAQNQNILFFSTKIILNSKLKYSLIFFLQQDMRYLLDNSGKNSLNFIIVASITFIGTVSRETMMQLYHP